jgi:aromatase
VNTEASSTGSTHRIEVRAPAEVVYRILADVSRWPLYFPPTVHAERVAGDDRSERIAIWALAHGELRTWESRRTLDPERLRVTFEQATPTDPVAAMGGAWSVLPTPDGATVVLDHHFRAVDDDPRKLDRIVGAVDANSLAELENLRRVAESAGRPDAEVIDFSDSETVTGSVEQAYDFIYDVNRWPERLPHVQAIDLTEDTPGLQTMRMDTLSPDGSVHTTVSGRVCTPGRRIVYKQTTLPAGLRAHTGEWSFEPSGPGTVTVTSRHQVILDAAAMAVLPTPPASLAEAARTVRNALGANSRATMARARAHVEAG